MYTKSCMFENYGHFSVFHWDVFCRYTSQLICMLKCCLCVRFSNNCSENLHARVLCTDTDKDVYIHQDMRPSVVHPLSVFSFLDDNLSRYKWIFTKFGKCIDIVEIWFQIANGQISSIFDRFLCPPQDSGGVLLFQIFILTLVMLNKFRGRAYF